MSFTQKLYSYVIMLRRNKSLCQKIKNVLLALYQKYYVLLSPETKTKKDMASLTTAIVIVFIVGYVCIALESVLKINKAAIALLMCVGCWTLLMLSPGAFYADVAGDNVTHHVAEVIEHHLGDAGGTLSSSWAR